MDERHELGLSKELAIDTNGLDERKFEQMREASGYENRYEKKFGSGAGPAPSPSPTSRGKTDRVLPQVLTSIVAPVEPSPAP